MNHINLIMVLGTVTKDPSYKTGQYGAVGRLSLAVNEKKRLKDGTIKEDVCFIDVDIYGKLAELCEQIGLKKGSRVIARGKLKLNTWEDKETGEKKSRHVIMAEDVWDISGKPMLAQEQEQPQPMQQKMAAQQTKQLVPNNYPKKQSNEIDDLPF